MLASNTLMRLAEGAKGLSFNRHLITGCTGMNGSVGSLYVFYFFDILSLGSLIRKGSATREGRVRLQSRVDLEYTTSTSSTKS